MFRCPGCGEVNIDLQSWRLALLVESSTWIIIPGSNKLTKDTSDLFQGFKTIWYFLVFLPSYFSANIFSFNVETL